jgi:phosphatidylglycerophosphatase C
MIQEPDQMQQGLALFDFDGTITEKDSFIEFIKYYKGLTSYFIGILMLSPILILYKMGLLKNWKAKELVFSYFFRGEAFEMFTNRCKDFSLNIIPRLVKPDALHAIKKHLSCGDRVIVVSASFESCLIDWCETMQIELIGTKPEIRNGLITGKIEGRNCYGIEKVKRLKQYLDISKFGMIYAYGDSKGDLPMLELANNKFYRST